MTMAEANANKKNKIEMRLSIKFACFFISFIPSFHLKLKRERNKKKGK